MSQRRMRIDVINPSHVSFGIGVITPRWLYSDETLEPLDASAIVCGDIVAIGIHTGNALRGSELAS